MRFGVTELLIILVIAILLFGTKKLRNIGGDLGGAIKGFNKAMTDTEDSSSFHLNIDHPDLTEKQHN